MLPEPGGGQVTLDQQKGKVLVIYRHPAIACK
jgi:hypothetical protein